jgi:oxaloacetate decarboxylase alpha subunit/pyruvate carboxylase subunit B
VLAPELEKAQEEIKGLAVDLDDEILYAIYPVTGKRFLKWKYGKEEPPEEVRAKTLEEAQKEQALIAKAKAGELIEKSPQDVPEKGEGLREFNVFVEDEYFKVGVEEIGGTPVISYVQPAPAPAAPQPAPAAPAPPKPAPAPPKAPAAAPAAPAPEKAAKPAPSMDADGTPLAAPMPGMIVEYEKEVGDAVTEGETVVVLEAMKMENALPAPVSGTILAINFKSGDSVAKGDVLAVIG